MDLIVLDNIGKEFEVTMPGGAAHHALPRTRHDTCRQTLWALKGVSCSIAHGEIVGVVGRNGAGKTTLLKIVAGVLQPTEGAVQVNGRIASLFTLGAGFQEELSGADNIYANGAVLGASRETLRHAFRDIVSFAELEEFIDMPLGHYSQGMRLRLAFAIAVHQPFDIFVIDEVMTVGDGAFQKKCFERLAELKRAGKAMLITTQSIDLLERLADRALLLEEGMVRAAGPAADVVATYRTLLFQEHRLKRVIHETTPVITSTKRWVENMNEWGTRQGTKDVVIERVLVHDRWGSEVHEVRPGERLTVDVSYTVAVAVHKVHFGVALFREDGVYCYGPNTDFDHIALGALSCGKGQFTFTYRRLCLEQGTYVLSVVIWDKKEVVAYDYWPGCVRVNVRGGHATGQLVRLLSRFRGWEWLPCWEDRRDCARTFRVPSETWQRALTSPDHEIRTVTVTDAHGRAVPSFSTGARVCIEIDLFTRPCGAGSPGAWIGLFRSDHVLCHTRTIELEPGRQVLSLVYPKLMLLPGEYYVTVALVQPAKDGVVALTPAVCRFAMHSTCQDHGTIYMDHRWHIRLPGGKVIKG